MFSDKDVPGSARFRYPAKFLVSVSRRTKASAVTRNRVKRVVKEAYRKNKSSFYSFLDKKQACCLLGMIYVGKEMPTYAPAVVTLQEILAILAERIEKEGLDHLGDVRQITVK